MGFGIAFEKTGASNSRERAYFQSMRLRTVSAACWSERSSANCMIVTSASLYGRLPSARKERGEYFVLKKNTEVISQGQVRITSGESSFGDTCGQFRDRIHRS